EEAGIGQMADTLADVVTDTDGVQQCDVVWLGFFQVPLFQSNDQGFGDGMATARTADQEGIAIVDEADRFLKAYDLHSRFSWPASGTLTIWD
ncbi:MAG: hypothetical protein H6Q04_2719, partial [Acidobacteria bacterium]|nr:hypothetical protein [Acidobacteriota bacterium]